MRSELLATDQRHLDACAALRRSSLAWLANPRLHPNCPTVKEALSPWTYSELLRAFAAMHDSYLDKDGTVGSNYPQWNAVRGITKGLSTSECLLEYAAFAETYPEYASVIGDEVVRFEWKWPNGFFTRPLIMALNEPAYLALAPRSAPSWTTYLRAHTSDDTFKLTMQQKSFIRLLTKDWHGTGLSLLETARTMVGPECDPIEQRHADMEALRR